MCFDGCKKTRSSAVAERPRDASCLSVVSFNILTAQFFLLPITATSDLLKGNLQPKLKVASVWPKSTAVITGVIFTCPGRAGPVFRLHRGLVHFGLVYGSITQWSHIFAQNHDFYTHTHNFIHQSMGDTKYRCRP